jgi:protein TonB
MNRVPLRAAAISVTLHAAAFAFVLMTGHAAKEREMVTVDVVWVSDGTVASPSPPAGSVSPPHSSGGAFAEPQTVRRDEAVRTMSPRPVEERDARSANRGVKYRPSAAMDGRQRKGAHPRETNETAASRGRRQVVAMPPAESPRSESFRTADVPDSTNPAAAPAHAPHAARDSQASGGIVARGSEDSASGPSNSMADSAEIVYRVAPTYPLAARRRGIEGSVLLRVRFDRAGRPGDISVMSSSGSPMLDDAARDAVARWRFRGGEAGALDLPITFRLVAVSGGGAVSLAHQGVPQ